MAKHKYKDERRQGRGQLRRLLGSAPEAINLAEGAMERGDIQRSARIEKGEHPDFH